MSKPNSLRRSNTASSTTTSVMSSRDHDKRCNYLTAAGSAVDQTLDMLIAQLASPLHLPPLRRRRSSYDALATAVFTISVSHLDSARAGGGGHA